MNVISTEKNAAPAIDIKNLNISYNGQEILKNINFQIPLGAVAAVIGPNGAGKTTLLKAMLGLIPYEGTIKILGKKISDVFKEIAYIPQKFTFDPTFPITPEEFLKLYLQSNKEGQIHRSLLEVGLENHKNKKIGDLSGGQLQRLLIARALLNNPQIVFLDEPTAGVDLHGETSFYDIIRHQNKAHSVTIVMVSHEINMVYRYANQILCLNKDLICNGIPKVAITNEVLTKLYGNEVSFREHKH
jgi:zinc transport system ATP-binding protein